MERLVKLMLSINMIGFIYRLNCHLSLHVVHIYPLLFIIYKESYIILICIILYFIFKIVYIYDEIIIIKEKLNEIKNDLKSLAIIVKTGNM